MDYRKNLKKQMSVVSTARQVSLAGSETKTVQRETSSNLKLSNVVKNAENYLNDYPKISDKEMSELTERFGNHFTREFVDNYHPSKILGEGGFGVAIAVCINRNRCMAVKIQDIPSQKDFDREMYMQDKFAKMELAPVILDEAKYFFHKGKKFAMLTMEVVDGDLLALLERGLPLNDIQNIAEDITDMIGILFKNGMTHGDFSLANMSYTFSKNSFSEVVLKPVLIDFGWSTTEFAFPQYDCLVMMQTLMPKCTPYIDPTARKVILTHLLKFYNANWQPAIAKHEQIIEKWKELSPVYQERVERNNYNKKPTSGTVGRNNRMEKNSKNLFPQKNRSLQY
jgi:tRNA A-37 threonylcarbamoyl transferase component Bud32